MIPAHDGPLAAIAFNAQGTKIASASEKVRTAVWLPEVVVVWCRSSELFYNKSKK